MQRVPADACLAAVWPVSLQTVLYPTMTSAPGAGISATGRVNSACATWLRLTASDPHGPTLMAMYSPAHSNAKPDSLTI
ncbi:hypothetical protein OGY71_20250 [Citrobacter sp. Cpo109]|uniref:hypothetical protein n=1 Tax=Citrobacter TaxID=544 RepID=UPI0025753F33|nr:MULTISPECIES: hypothetical protein [Citrobacter]MDM2804706.1 hypothetical protein [Citrobacter sp. Cpo109]MEB1110778.1 hypothetical protein [Citrobacter portucalensis]